MYRERINTSFHIHVAMYVQFVNKNKTNVVYQLQFVEEKKVSNISNSFEI